MSPYQLFNVRISSWSFSTKSGIFLIRDAVMMELEICVDSVESAVAAEIGGAQRVELCSALSEGGLTPSMGLIRAVRAQINIGIYAMIRPRGGDFYYSGEEFSIMRDDIVYAAAAGVDGIVLGLTTPDGDIDVDRTRSLIEQARSVNRSIEVTFHRAIDMTRDLDKSLEDVIRTGAHRILTSGGAPSALAGSERTAALVHAAGNRIRIMVCGRVRAANIKQIAQTSGAKEFHASLRKAVPSPVTYRNPTLHMGDAGSDEYTRHAVHTEDVRHLRQALDSIASGHKRSVQVTGLNASQGS
jgi:copper homeostasis protein